MAGCSPLASTAHCSRRLSFSPGSAPGAAVNCSVDSSDCGLLKRAASQCFFKKHRYGDEIFGAVLERGVDKMARTVAKRSLRATGPNP